MVNPHRPHRTISLTKQNTYFGGAEREFNGSQNLRGVYEKYLHAERYSRVIGQLEKGWLTEAMSDKPVPWGESAILFGHYLSSL